MWSYGMMGYGGWMFFWGIGGLLLLGAVIYAAVRVGTYHARGAGYGYHDCHPRDDQRYGNGENRYRPYRGGDR